MKMVKGYDEIIDKGNELLRRADKIIAEYGKKMPGLVEYMENEKEELIKLNRRAERNRQKCIDEGFK